MREAAGIVWTELQHRRYQRLANSPRLTMLEAHKLIIEMEPIETTLKCLESCFPDAIAFERELWHDALAQMEEREQARTRANAAPELPGPTADFTMPPNDGI